MKHKFILILSVVAGLTAMFLTKVYIDARVKALEKRFQTVEVVVAAKDLTAGTTLTLDMIRKDSIPSQNAGTAVRADDFSRIINRKLTVTIRVGEPIRWSSIEGDEQKGGSMAGMVNEGDRAISIPVDVISSVTGHIEPNDHVDILGTFTFPSTKGDPQLDTVTLTILQNVVVLATGKETSRTMMESGLRGMPRRLTSYSAVTLLVTPKEAELLVFAMGKGRLTLTLRNPADVSSAEDLTSINFNYLEKKVGDFNKQRQERLRRGVTP